MNKIDIKRKLPKTRKGKIILTISIIVFIALFFFVKKKIEVMLTPPAKPYSVVVNVAVVKSGILKASQKYLGDFRPENDAIITAKVSAKLDYIASEGTPVKIGQVVAKLDSKDIQSNIQSLVYNKRSLESTLSGAYSEIEAANTQLANAKNNLERYQYLYKVEAVPKVELETMENNYKAAEANQKTAISHLQSIQESIKSVDSQIASLEDSLTYSVITSPFNGLVVKKYFNEGDTVVQGKPILEITGGENSLVYVSVPVEISSKVKVDDIETIAYNGKTAQAVVDAVLSSSDNNLNMIKLKLNSNPFNLPAHTMIDTYIYTGSAKGFIVPNNSIVKSKGKTYVIVVGKDNRAKFVGVNILAQNDKESCVSGALTDNSEVVTGEDSLLLRIYENQPLEVVKE
ncbi:MAG TPA: efflux RND transporter periplasmic adaptor subunit [Thermodesulfobium narugense]|nr:MAG: efflux RND transporter periplasmic adaptor subunit [Thermodesulfobium narugense]HEM56068.1 efflux RND transporter periplasmic adaptor subunit [Thermodesulfobium narugense]